MRCLYWQTCCSPSWSSTDSIPYLTWWSTPQHSINHDLNFWTIAVNTNIQLMACFILLLYYLCNWSSLYDLHAEITCPLGIHKPNFIKGFVNLILAKSMLYFIIAYLLNLVDHVSFFHLIPLMLSKSHSPECIPRFPTLLTLISLQK